MDYWEIDSLNSDTEKRPKPSERFQQNMDSKSGEL